MKRILNIIILIILLMGISTLVYADTASNNVTLTCSSQDITEGDTITITLKTTQKIQAADFTINYTNDVLEFVSTSIDEEHYNATNSGGIKVCTYSTKGVDKYDFTFKVKKEGEFEASTNIEALNIDNDNPLEFDNKTLKMIVKKRIPVTSISLDKTTASLKVGENLKLVATITPENATDKIVTWTSSDTAVAIVSNGTITALKAGTATITATAGEKTATCTITIKEVEPPKTDDDDNDKKIEVTSITLDKTTASLKVGENLKLVATIAPENATDKTIAWKSSDTSIAIVSNGIVTALKAGTVTITATVGTKSVSSNITVTDTFNNTDNTNNKGDTSGVSKTPDKETSNVSDKDTSVAKDPIPQTGETLAIVVTIIGVISILIISIVKYKKYRDII